MKNKIIFISICLLIFAVVATNFVLAENDNEQERETNYQPLQSITIPEPVLTTTVNNYQPLSIPANSAQIFLIDSDSDGVIDSLDKYPDEDDFAFAVADTNLNGIIDNLEYLQTRAD